VTLPAGLASPADRFSAYGILCAVDDRLLDPTGDLSVLRSALHRSRDLGLTEDQLDKLRRLYAEARRELNEAGAACAAAELELELAGTYELLTLRSCCPPVKK
jgi:hypothetical protein